MKKSTGIRLRPGGKAGREGKKKREARRERELEGWKEGVRVAEGFPEWQLSERAGKPKPPGTAWPRPGPGLPADSEGIAPGHRCSHSPQSGDPFRSPLYSLGKPFPSELRRPSRSRPSPTRTGRRWPTKPSQARLSPDGGRSPAPAAFSAGGGVSRPAAGGERGGGSGPFEAKCRAPQRSLRRISARPTRGLLAPWRLPQSGVRSPGEPRTGPGRRARDPASRAGQGA